MARTLPWLTGKAAAQATNPSDRYPAVRLGNPPEEAASDDDLPPAAPLAEVNATARRKRRASRTPSTSPPPAPPAEEFMRPGYDKDDGWMMVEDEFYAVAQQFTLPLHRQEYERLKEKARNERLKVKDIARPTNTLAMRKELRQKKEAKRLRTKQKQALDDMTGGLLRDSDSGGDAVSDKEDDPWYGTTLHGLMASPQKVQKALVGLEKVHSTTRAAAGFSKPDHSPIRPRSSGFLSGDARPLERDKVAISGAVSDDYDDLDALPATSTSKSHPRLRARPKLQASNLSSNFGESTPEQSSNKATGFKGFDDEFDNFLQSPQRVHMERKPPLSANPTPKKKYSEVPTFLV